MAAATSQGAQVRTLTTDERGYFDTELEPGLYTVRVGSWQRTVLVDRPIILAPLTRDPSVAEVDVGDGGWVALPAAGPEPPVAHIEGRAVEHRLLGKPVAGAWAWIDGYAELAVPSREDGSFRLLVPQAEGLSLRVEKPGYIPARAPARGGPPGEVGRAWSVPLHPAAYLQGRVVGGDGDPVTAEVTITPRNRDSAWTKGLGEAETAHTDGGGTFTLATAPEEPVELRVEAPGHVPETLSLTTPAVGTWSPLLEVTLPKAALATGRVLTDEGRPIAGAEVAPLPAGSSRELLRRLAGRKPRRGDAPATPTDGEGRFVLRDLPPGIYDLAVVAAGFEPVAVSGLTLAAVTEPQDVGTVFLAPAATLEGQVVDGSGEPLPGAEIYVALLAADGRSSMGRSGVSAVSDEEGRFVVGDLARGSRVVIAARRAGFLPRSISGVPVPGEDPIRIELSPAGRLSGTVRDDRGDPVEGAKVVARSTASRGSLLRSDRILSPEAGGVTTDAEGVYRMVQVEPGPITLRVQADCCLPEELELRMEPEDRPPVVDVELRRGTTVRGKVLSFAGQPVGGARVGANGKTAITEDDGSFHLAGLEEGTATLSAHHARHGHIERSVEVRREARVELRFLEPGRIAGQVLNQSHTAIAGAQVTVECGDDWWSGRVTSRADGSFEHVAQPGECTVAARKPGFVPSRERTVLLPAGETVRADVTLSEGSALHGRLHGAEAFELARTELVANAAGRAPQRGRLDPDGNFEIHGLQPGVWRVVATTPAGRRAEGQVEIREGQRRARLELEFDRGSALRGVVSLNGRPLASAWVKISSLEGLTLAHTLSDTRGGFEIQGLDEPRVQLDVATKEGDLRWSRTVEVGTPLPVEVAIHTGTLSGQVVGAQASFGVAGASVRVEPLGDSTWLPMSNPRTGPEGSFGPWRFPAARYRVTVTAPGFQPSVTDVEIEAGREQVLTVPLSPAQPD